MIGRRKARTLLPLFGGLLLAACTVAAEASSFTMYRDPNCGCCEEWAAHMEMGERHDVATVDHPDMLALKTAHGVPDDLRSCHTAIGGGLVIEGHVPAADIERMMVDKPDWVEGLAVAGMPLGSPGMEVEGPSQPYEVIAFGNGRREVFASYP